ncbi:protein NO VEIN domain-containing protein [Enterobacter roggenkampii]|uniref:protein NO VEIN domain-containing protein n=1 Tax=Enterobacter roggenkampii TaxID=1812935 RepID=UPI001C673B7E|nr:DUF3883 domain-containing protein [Enterobacter roggenkampii]
MFQGATSLEGFDHLVELLSKLTIDQRVYRARLLWESLIDLEERRGRGVFDGLYTWSHYGERRTPPFPTAFIRRLNKAEWVPDADGNLVQPHLVVFDSLGWKNNPFLLTKIAFKPPILDQLAREAGIDPAILDLLRRDPTIVAELASRLSDNPIQECESPIVEVLFTGDVYGDAMDLYGDNMPHIPPGTPDPDSYDIVNTGTGRSGQGSFSSGSSHDGALGSGGVYGGSGGHNSSGYKGSQKGGRQRMPGNAGGRPFISYVGTHPNDDDLEPGNFDQAERMQIEACAIDLIIGLEPALQRTPEGNPGFDLFEVDSSGGQIRWVEVKSMTGSLEDHPVGLSHTQFNYAREKGDAYWLYVVEYTTDLTKARLLKIQNPVSRARTFTFDHGWREIASIEVLHDCSPDRFFLTSN